MKATRIGTHLPRDHLCPSDGPVREPDKLKRHRDLRSRVVVLTFRGMELVSQTFDSVIVVTLHATHLDVTNTSTFRRLMSDELELSQNVVLDLGHIDFLDSSGLGSLLSLLRTLSKKGGDMRLCGVSSSVAALLHLVRLDQIIQIFGSPEEAVRSFDD